jgi:hypothetical protein
VDLVGAGDDVLAPARGFGILRVCDSGRAKKIRLRQKIRLACESDKARTALLHSLAGADT